MKHSLSVLVMSVILCSVGPAYAADDAAADGETASWAGMNDLDLMELMNLEVVSASNTAEKLSEAPARVLVVTGNEMVERGYSSLLDVFADLPSVDLAITYGDLYYKAYWRGYRKDASPFLFMIDGRIMNHLWFNRTDMLATVSIANIDRVEVVYGPASAVYGPNAMMGVFHIITKKEYGKDGRDYGATVHLGGGSFDERRADVSMGYNKDDFSLQITGTMHNLGMDEASLSQYQYTDPAMANDRELWGAVLDVDSLSGAIKAGTFRSFMVSSQYKDFEVGMAYFDKASGYGTNYAFDKNNPRGWWREPDLDLYAKTSIEISDIITSHTMIRYRRSDVTNDNFSNEGYNEGDIVMTETLDESGAPVIDQSGNHTMEKVQATDDEGNLVFKEDDDGVEILDEDGKKVPVWKRESGRFVSAAYWQSLNSSWYVQQDFDIVPMDDLVIKTGINLEDRDIQKAYDLPSGPRVAPEDFTIGDAPASPADAAHFENRLRWVNMGAYAQVRYDIGSLFDSAGHLINTGVRYHNNSLYGESVTLRGGYVGDLDIINLKILGGQSFQEPSPKQLFGAWAGSGVNEFLSPETSTTIEAVVDWASENFSVTVNPYFVMVSDLILEIDGAATNIGKRTIIGGDLFLRGRMSLPGGVNLRGWLNYGFIEASEQESEGAESRPVGDIAPHKINFGITAAMLDGDVSLNLRGRYVHDRETVQSNPLGTIPAFFTADANLLVRNLVAKGVGFSLRMNNITGAAYSHPGIRGANAGDTAGAWNADGQYIGSDGWSSSKLPQPGRSFMASLHLDI